MAELLEDGVIERHARRDALSDALRRELPDAVQFEAPPGGMALWIRTAAGIDVEAWAARTVARGAHLPTARAFAFDRRPRPAAQSGMPT